jgi:hypothetical protein
VKPVTRVGLLVGAAAALTGYTRFIRPWTLTWGATPEEVSSRLPGDDLVRGQYVTTHAITIARPATQVWPWLVQMGYQRGGWYSYDRLEKAVGIGDFADGGSAQRILPDLQSLIPGDTVDLSPNGGFTVVGLKPERSLVLRIPMDPLTGGPASHSSRVVLDWTWAFVLQPTTQGCRLIIRVRGDLRPRWLALTLPLLDPIHLMMERKMLQTIKQRAEASNPGLTAARRSSMEGFADPTREMPAVD